MVFNTSSVPVPAGRTVAQTIIVPIQGIPQVRMMADAGTHVILDLAGYFTFAN